MPVENRNKNEAGRYRYAQYCPYCGSKCLTGGSTPMSVLTRVARVRCQNYDCGWTGLAMIEVVKTLSPPSAKYWREQVLPLADEAFIDALPPASDK